MSKLLDYLNHLDKNVDARDAHAADPSNAMTTFGLSQDEQDALLSCDRQRVAGAIGIPAEDVPVIFAPQGAF